MYKRYFKSSRPIERKHLRAERFVPIYNQHLLQDTAHNLLTHLARNPNFLAKVDSLVAKNLIYTLRRLRDTNLYQRAYVVSPHGELGNRAGQKIRLLNKPPSMERYQPRRKPSTGV